jgi:hypothetical protein
MENGLAAGPLACASGLCACESLRADSEFVGGFAW